MDSFDERIDDDLFEVIISYLPIIDKLRYESVSKRFQRFVFNKQKVLAFSWSEDTIDNICVEYLKISETWEINVSKLERLLKKFRFITKIVFEEIYVNESEVLHTIIQNCNHLTFIDIDLFGISFKTLKEFCQKFGQHLRHISFISDYKRADEISVKKLTTVAILTKPVVDNSFQCWRSQ